MDYAHKLTDDELKALEKRISDEYKQAEKEVEEKLNNYLSSFARKDAIEAQKVADGIITQKEYDNWRVNQMATGKRWDNLRNSLAEDYHNANMIARGMTTDQSKEVYALNYNYGGFEVESATGLDTGFILYDKSTVERLMRDDPQMLPPPGKKVAERIKAGQDVLWNNQQIQSVMMQSLLQGESIGKIANRLAVAVGDSNKVGAIRNARTMTTGAENAGRVDSYKRAEEMGIKLKQMWVATLDERTRQSHRELDGQSVEPGEVFSNGCEYPGDPKGRPEEVYNCRCTLVAKLPGVPYTFAERGTDKEEYLEWKKGHEEAAKSEPIEETKVEPVIEEAKTEPVVEDIPEQEETKTDERVVVQGKDLSATWKRRKDEFEFEIEDAINAQGFDGLPQIVSADDFDKAVEASGFIAQRTYSAVDFETLEAYQDSLYNGKWYVDCSVGGSAHGKGMYCAANYEGKLTDEIKQEMQDYIGQNKHYTDQDAPYIIETFTVDPSANFLEVPEKMEEDDYIWGMYIDHVFEEYGKALGKEDEVKIINELRDEKGIAYNNFLHGKIKSEELYAINAEMNEKIKEITDENRDLGQALEDAVLRAEKVHDIGSMTALMGYDGIHTHYGTCGNDTIIVNRTKLIFKGE